MAMATLPIVIPTAMTRIIQIILCVIVAVTCSSIHGTGRPIFAEGKLISSILESISWERGRQHIPYDLDPKQRMKRGADLQTQSIPSSDAATPTDAISSTNAITSTDPTQSDTTLPTGGSQFESTLGVTSAMTSTFNPIASDSTKVDGDIDITNGVISSVAPTVTTIISTILIKTTTQPADSTNQMSTRKTPGLTEKTTQTDKASRSPTICGQREVILTDFGKYGVLALAIASGVAFLFCFSCLLVACIPRCIGRKRKFKTKKKKTHGNSSDMRAPSIYHPRPSQVGASTPCVPTPLAMIITNDPTSTSSLRKTSDIMVTDLDDADDMPVTNGAGMVDEDSNRKLSFIDPNNVTTFLLRQTSIKREEEEKRKASLTSQLQQGQH